VRKQMSFHPVSSMEEVLFLALESPDSFFKDQERARIIQDRLRSAREDKKEDDTPEAWDQDKPVHQV